MSFRFGLCMLFGLTLLVGTGCKTEDEKTPAQGKTKVEGQTPDSPGTQSPANAKQNADKQGETVPTPDENPDVKKVE